MVRSNWGTNLGTVSYLIGSILHLGLKIRTSASRPSNKAVQELETVIVLTEFPDFCQPLSQKGFDVFSNFLDKGSFQGRG